MSVYYEDGIVYEDNGRNNMTREVYKPKVYYEEEYAGNPADINPRTRMVVTNRKFGDYGYTTGTKVKALQAWLNKTVSRNNQLVTDGVYGPKTREAVKLLQRFINANLNAGIKVDGLYGPNTYRWAVKIAKAFNWPSPPLPVYGSIPASNLPAPSTIRPEIKVAEVNNGNESFLSKYKWYFLGAGVLMAGAVAFLMLSKNKKIKQKREGLLKRARNMMHVSRRVPIVNRNTANNNQSNSNTLEGFNGCKK